MLLRLGPRASVLANAIDDRTHIGTGATEPVVQGELLKRKPLPNVDLGLVLKGRIINAIPSCLIRQEDTHKQLQLGRRAIGEAPSLSIRSRRILLRVGTGL